MKTFIELFKLVVDPTPQPVRSLDVDRLISRYGTRAVAEALVLARGIDKSA